MEESTTAGAPSAAPLSLFSDTRRAARLVLGAAVLLAWLALMVVGLAQIGDDSTVRVMSDLLLAAVALAGLIGLLRVRLLTILAAVAAVSYAAAWWLLGWNSMWGGGGVLYYLAAAAFYIAPLVVGLLSILSAVLEQKR